MELLRLLATVQEPETLRAMPNTLLAGLLARPFRSLAAKVYSVDKKTLGGATEIKKKYDKRATRPTV